MRVAVLPHVWIVNSIRIRPRDLEDFISVVGPENDKAGMQ